MAFYNPTPNTQLPGNSPSTTGQHFGLPWANSEGSAYATLISATTTELIAKEIEKTIFPTVPQQYDAALSAFLYMNTIQDMDSDEFFYHERGFGRSAMEVFTWTSGTGVIVLAGTYSEANDIPVTVNDIVTLPGTNKPATVTVVTWSVIANTSQITVVPYTGASFVAGDAAVGDLIPFMAAGYTDGLDFIGHYDRLDTVSRYNFIQMFARARRWGDVEMQKFLNKGTTNNIAEDKANSIEQLKTDLLACYLNGTRGAFPISFNNAGSVSGKAMGGLYPLAVAAGAPSATVTSSGLQPALESLLFQTNTLAKGATRFLLGTDESLYEMSKSFKNPILYSPNDTIANMNLKEYEIGTNKVVPMVIPQMGNSSIFPAFFSRMVLGIDQKSIIPVKLKGKPHITLGQMKSMNSGANNLNGYTDWWVQAFLSMKFQNPAASFIINRL